MQPTSDTSHPRTAVVHDRFARTVVGLGLALSALLPAAADADLSVARHVTIYGASVQAPSQPQQSALAQRIGRPESMHELVSRLLLAVADLSGHGARNQQPQVTRIALAELHGKLCGGACTVRAAYVPGEGLYLDEALRPDLNAYHQSILFHELVHHVQEEQGMHAELDSCNRWRLREVEAYRLQNQFLAAIGARTQVFDPGIPCATETTHAYREQRR